MSRESMPLRELTPEDYDVFGARRRNAATRNWRFVLLTGLLFSGILTLILIFLLYLEPSMTSVQTANNTAPGLLQSTNFPIQERKEHVMPTGPMRSGPPATVVSRCLQRGREEMESRRRLEAAQRPVAPQSPTSYHQAATALDPQYRALVDGAVQAEASLHALMRETNISLATLRADDLSGLLRNWPHCDAAIATVACDPTGSPFRTLDGSCNNIERPQWGAALQPFRRVLAPAYGDGFAAPRTKSVAGSPLPSARAVSLPLQGATSMVYETRFSTLFLTWGQFLDHDITATAPTKGADGASIACCDRTVSLHPECFPIDVATDDHFYGKKGIRCLDLVRSAPALQCQVGEREQMNQNSAYIDASMVYGTTHLEANVRLRVHERGYLRSRLHQDGRFLLAISTDPKDGCNRPQFNQINRYCFKSGDMRTNEQIGLTALHTVMVREHNRIASELVDLNPHWDDDRVYEETRRIIGAFVQHITYNEFVPLLLGEELTDRLKVRPLTEGYDTSYDATVDAGISNAFATAAFRFGHSMLQGLVVFQGARGRSVDYVQLQRTLFNPFPLWDFGQIDAVFRGAAEQNPRVRDTSFSSQTTNHLFQAANASHGLDLFAVNVQRGRDHGLPPYVQWRTVCGLDSVTEWSHLETVMRPTSLHLIKSVFTDVSDVDLYVGILAEEPLADAILGPVGTCLVADQLVRLKRGDRFWYETADERVGFRPDQLSEIRRISLARLLCDNGDALDAVQPRAMQGMTVDHTNRRVACSDDAIARFDLAPWLEQQTADDAADANQ